MRIIACVAFVSALCLLVVASSDPTTHKATMGSAGTYGVGTQAMVPGPPGEPEPNGAPWANDTTLAIAENSDKYEVVGTVAGGDPDEDPLSWSIVDGNTGDAFAIGSGTGVIDVYTAAMLDHETTPIFNLSVRASDGSLADTAAVSVNVTDVNENPWANDTTLAVDENSVKDVIVGTVGGGDPEDGALAWSITAGNTGNAFAIGSATGIVDVETPGALDYETTPTFNLTVRATDPLSLYDEAAVTINLNDLDDTAPAAPTALVAALEGFVVRLDWANGAEADLDSYRVYRSESIGSGYALLAAGLEFSVYDDTATSGAGGTKYYYRVTALDNVPNESAYSGVDSATVPAQSFDYQLAGIGGGGYVFATEPHPVHRNAIFVGGDVTSASMSWDGGATYSTGDPGISDLPWDGKQHYFSGAVGVSNSYFEGFVVAGRAGIFSRELGSPSYVYVSHPDSGYIYTHDYGWDQWDYPIPLSRVAWDGSNFLVAGAGETRWYSGNETAEIAAYPEVVYACALGTYSVWRYQYGDPSGAEWRPWVAFGDIGAVRDISVALVGSDTICAVASRDGIYLWDGDSLVDLTNYPVNHGVSSWDSFTVNGAVGHKPYSIHITPREELYLGIDVGTDTATEPKAGVYLMANCVEVGAEWNWVGDGTTVEGESPNASVWDMARGGPGVSGDGSLLYVSVLNGSGSDPDTVIAGDRRSAYAGLLRAYVTPSSPQTADWISLIWKEEGGAFGSRGGAADNEGWEVSAEYSVGASVISHPGLVPGGHIISQTQARLHKSTDYGETWNQIYTTSDGGDGWRSRGYSQQVTRQQALDVFPQGSYWEHRAVASGEDWGLFISTDSTWTYWDPMHDGLETDWGGTAPHTVARVWTNSVQSVDVVADYLGTGIPAVLAIWGDALQEGRPGQVMVLYDDDDDSVMTWVAEPSFWVPNPKRYNYRQVLGVGDDIYATYSLYTADIGGGGSRTSWGVMKFAWDDTGYAYSDWSTGLSGADMGAVDPKGLLYSSTTGEIYTATNGASGATNGGVWARGLADGSWRRIMGDGASTTVRDIFCIALSPDQDILYAGINGQKSLDSAALWKTSDPEATTPAWTQLTNTADTPIHYTIPTGAIMDSRGYGTALLRSQRRCGVSAVHVDEMRPNDVWFGIDDNGSSAFTPGYAGLYMLRDDTLLTNFSADIQGQGFPAASFAQDRARVLVAACGADWFHFRNDSLTWDATIPDSLPYSFYASDVTLPVLTWGTFTVESDSQWVPWTANEMVKVQYSSRAEFGAWSAYSAWPGERILTGTAVTAETVPTPGSDSYGLRVKLTDRAGNQIVYQRHDPEWQRTYKFSNSSTAGGTPDVNITANQASFVLDTTNPTTVWSSTNSLVTYYQGWPGGLPIDGAGARESFAGIYFGCQDSLLGKTIVAAAMGFTMGTSGKTFNASPPETLTFIGADKAWTDDWTSESDATLTNYDQSVPSPWAIAPNSITTNLQIGTYNVFYTNTTLAALTTYENNVANTVADWAIGRPEGGFWFYIRDPDCGGCSLAFYHPANGVSTAYRPYLFVTVRQ